MYEKFGQFIDGKWQQSSSGETYEVINPATEEIIGKASKANSEDIQRALKSAEKGLEIWRNTSPWERSKVIRKISELIRKKNDGPSIVELEEELNKSPQNIEIVLKIAEAYFADNKFNESFEILLKHYPNN